MNKLYKLLIDRILIQESFRMNELAESLFKLSINEVGDLDVSIKHLKKEINTPEKAKHFLSKTISVEEKIDGTKLILVRTDVTDAKDYYNNWIVSYKGSILYPEEFRHLSDKEKEDIKASSIGISQYALVFDKLKSINKNVGRIPKNTAFSIEFAQNKETLTRTYKVFQALFLRTYAPVKYYVDKGFLTLSSGAEVTDKAKIKSMADILGISTFPILLEGKIDTAENFSQAIRSEEFRKIFSEVSINYNDPLDIVGNFSNMVLKIESSLGGMPEGAVISTSDGKLYKVTQEDQYDVSVRGAKKELFKMEPEAEKVYNETIRQIAKKLIDQLDLSEPINVVLQKYNNSLKSVNLDKILHTKKKNVNKMDDLMLTGKFIIQQSNFIGRKTKTLGVVPMAGKPVHIGHWKLIELAARENEKVLVYVSNKGRIKKGEHPITGHQMIDVWNIILRNYLPKNVSIKFVDSPVAYVRYLLGDLNSDPEDAPIVNVYSDVEDIKNYDLAELNAKYVGIGSLGKMRLRGVERTSTVDISGTKMRSFLQSGDKETFFSYLPPVKDVDKEKIWNILKP